MTFFIVYGKKSVWGLVIFALLLATYLFCTFDMIRKKSINSYKSYLKEIFPRKLSVIVEISVIFFTLSSFVVMLSGFGAVAEQMFSLPNIFGAIILSAFCFFVFTKNSTGIVNAGAYLTPIIIVFIVVIGVLSMQESIPAGAFHTIKILTDNFVFSSFIYVSYNTISLTPVLIGIKDFIKTKKDICLVTFFSSAILGIMAILIWYSLVKFDKTIVYNEIPMLDIATHLSSVMSSAYTLVLFCAMLTTAVSAGFAFLTGAEKLMKIPYKKLSACLCVFSVPLSQIGFASLIENLYRFFGYIGIGVFIMGIIKYFLKK